MAAPLYRDPAQEALDLLRLRQFTEANPPPTQAEIDAQRERDTMASIYDNVGPVLQYPVNAVRLGVPALVGGAYEALKSGVMYPGQVLYGELPPPDITMQTNPEATIGKLMDTASIPAAGMLPRVAGRMDPNTLSIFAGREAATADRSALAIAQNYERAGMDPKEIWKTTGWGRGADGEWRFEIDDSKLELRPHPSDSNAFTVFHPDFERAYPGLLDKINQDIRLQAPTSSMQGYWEPSSRTLQTRGTDMESLRSVALHELQHAAQSVERFAAGTAPSSDAVAKQRLRIPAQDIIAARNAAQRDLAAVDDQLKAVYNSTRMPQEPEWTKLDRTSQIRITNELLGDQGPLAKLRPTFVKAFDIMNNGPSSPYSTTGIYRREAGEAEARNAQFRMDYPEDLRRSWTPFDTQDVPTNQQWVAPRSSKMSWNADGTPNPVGEALRVSASEPLTYRVGDELAPAGSGYRPVPGKPANVDIPGIGKVEARPIAPLIDTAESYMRSIGRPGEHEIKAFPSFDEDRARRIAEQFALMKHDPSDPRVKRAYDAMIEETMAQYRSLKDAGMDFRFMKDGDTDPYAASPALGYADLVRNGRLTVFPTDFGFGTSAAFDPATNPLLKGVGKIGNKPDAVANDAFRVVHDAYGHFAPGNPFFRHQGEERAWAAHSRMYSPEALPAMTSETRGQNSWLNFGPHGEANRKALGADTVFADQKTGIMDPWTWTEGKFASGGAVDAALDLAQQPVSRKDMNYKDVTKRTPQLTEAAGRLYAGEMAPDEYASLVRAHKPVEPYATVPEPTSEARMRETLHSNKVDKIGVPHQLPEGHPVGLRLDIPAYRDHGAWINSVHEQNPNNFWAGQAIGYTNVSAVKNARFGVMADPALDYARGDKAKATFAVIKGNWSNVSPEEAHARATDYLDHPDWVQVGMDPERHSFFYDRKTMEPVEAADEVLQIGPLVLAKNPVYGDRSKYRYAEGGGVPVRPGALTAEEEALALARRPVAARAVARASEAAAMPTARAAALDELSAGRPLGPVEEALAVAKPMRAAAAARATEEAPPMPAPIRLPETPSPQPMPELAPPPRLPVKAERRPILPKEVAEPPVPKASPIEAPSLPESVDEHRLGVERGERKTIKSAKLTDNEKSLLAEFEPPQRKAAADRILSYRAANPISAGSEPIEARKVAFDEKGNPVIDWQKIAYGYHIPEGETRAPKPGTPTYEKHADRVANDAFKAVTNVVARANAGDEAARKILRQVGWYRETMAKGFNERGGAYPAFADALGATSPNTSVDQNYRYSVEGQREFARGTHDDKVRFMRDWSGPLDKVPPERLLRRPGVVDKVTGEEKQYGMNSRNLAMAFADRWRDLFPAQKPKARNFSGNLGGATDEATIDVWAARFLRRMAGQKRIPVAAESNVGGDLGVDLKPKGEFGFGQDVFRRLAKKLNKSGHLTPFLKELGYGYVTPMDLQALTWFIEKEHWTKNNWTTAAGEGGSFEDEIRKFPTERWQAGHSVTQAEAPSDEVMAAERKRIEAVLRDDPGVRVYRVHPTFGAYGGTNERSFDTELSAAPDWNPEAWMRAVVEQARDHNQSDVFFSRRIPDHEVAIHPNARPGVEVYFQDRKTIEDIAPILDRFAGNDLDGFTYVTDLRIRERDAGGKSVPDYVGVRLQWVPEITQRFDDEMSASWLADPAAIESAKDAAIEKMRRVLDEIDRQGHSIVDARIHHYDTLVLGKEDYDGFLESGTPATGIGEGGGRGWLGQPLSAHVARRDRALGARDGGRPDDLAGGTLGESQPVSRASGGRVVIDDYLAQRAMAARRGAGGRIQAPRSVSAPQIPEVRSGLDRNPLAAALAVSKR